MNITEIAAGIPEEVKAQLQQTLDDLVKGIRGKPQIFRRAEHRRRSHPRNSRSSVKYVLDGSVALKWVLPEADSGKAIRLRDEYSNGLHELLAPDIFPSEIANGLASAERRKRIRTGESAIFLNDVLSAAPALHPSAPLLIRAMEIAVSTKQAVYDCIYLALAEAEGCELVTADDQFARGLRTSYPFIVSLVALP